MWTPPHRIVHSGQTLYFHLPSSHVQLGPFQLKIRNYTVEIHRRLALHIDLETFFYFDTFFTENPVKDHTVPSKKIQ